MLDEAFNELGDGCNTFSEAFIELDDGDKMLGETFNGLGDISHQLDDSCNKLGEGGIYIRSRDVFNYLTASFILWRPENIFSFWKSNYYAELLKLFETKCDIKFIFCFSLGLASNETKL